MKDRLRIGYVCFGTYGGSGVIATELAKGMAARGHHVHLVASNLPARLRGAASVFFHQVSAAHYPALDQPPYALAVASKIVEVATDHRLDLVHVHYAVPHATSAYLAQQVLGEASPKMLLTLHGTDVTRVGVDPSVQTINRFSITAMDGVTVPSQWLAEQAHAHLGVPEAFSIDVVPNFVDTARFSPARPRDRRALARWFDNGVAAEDTPVLVHVSNFRAVKRVPDVAEAFAAVVERTPARLLLVGDGPDRARVAHRLRELGLSRRASFVGAVGDVVDLVRHADVFLFPSESESFGLAALEAASCGVPVVGYAVGGLPEVIRDGETGYLTPAGDPAAMAQATLRLLDDEGEHRRMAEAARARAVETFDTGRTLDRYTAVYRRVLDARGHDDDA